MLTCQWIESFPSIPTEDISINLNKWIPLIIFNGNRKVSRNSTLLKFTTIKQVVKKYSMDRKLPCHTN